MGSCEEFKVGRFAVLGSVRVLDRRVGFTVFGSSVIIGVRRFRF